MCCTPGRASASLAAVWPSLVLILHLVFAGKVEDLGSGEYRAHFTATVAGSYAVSASLNGTGVAGSPFAAIVSAAEVDAACSYAAGDGVLGACSGHLVGVLPDILVVHRY